MPTIDIPTVITGNVWKIVAKEGDQIAENQPILILESMKMEIPISAPEDGVLSAILVKEGDTVTEGTTVARMDV